MVFMGVYNVLIEYIIIKIVLCYVNYQILEISVSQQHITFASSSILNHKYGHNNKP